jgi:hypothetical protein
MHASWFQRSMQRVVKAERAKLGPLLVAFVHLFVLFAGYNLRPVRSRVGGRAGTELRRYSSLRGSFLGGSAVLCG